MWSIIYTGLGTPEGDGSGPSLVWGKVGDDGVDFIIGSGQEGLGILSIISNNDWMRIDWDFDAPHRGRFMRELFGPPNAKPRRSHVFDLRGFREATRNMARACNWW